MGTGRAAPQTLGVEYTAEGLRDILQDLTDMTKATLAAERAIKSFWRAAKSNKTPTQYSSITATPGSNTQVQNNHKLVIVVSVRYPNGGNPGGGSGGGRGSGQGGGGKGRQAGVGGPRQRLSQLRSDLAGGTLTGDRLADTQSAYDRLSKRMQPRTITSKILDVLKTSRYDLGAMHPLVGRTLNAAGVDAEAAAPALIAGGLLATAEIAAAKALYDLAQQTAATTNAFERVAIQLGSGAATTAKLSAYATSIGLSPESLASIAQGIQGRISSGGVSTAAGMQLGVFNLPGIYGNQDYGQQALTIIQHLRNIQDPAQRLRLARAVGAEDLLPLTNLSQGQFRYAQQDAGITSSIMSSTNMVQDAADFQAAEGRISDSIKNLVAAAGQGEVERLTSAFNGIASLLNTAAEWANKNKTLVDMVVAGGEHLIAGGAVGTALEMGRAIDSQHKSLDDNTRATIQNTQAVLQPGTYGRIDRLGSMPYGVVNGQALAMSHDIATKKLSTY